MTAFGVFDYVVFLSTVGVSFSIGIYFGIRDRKNNSPSNYFLAGRSFNFLPAALSFVVTFQSSLMILGTPIDVYLYGISYCYYCVGIIIAYTFAGIFVVPIFHTIQVTSVYKYFELRYGSNEVRYLAVLGGVMYNILYMSMVTYGTCVALEVVIGIPYWATILLYTTVTTIYTSVGGMKAVIWTDVFQLVIMVTGVIAVLVKSTNEAGGPENVFRLAADRLDLNTFQIDPRIRFQFWNVSLGSISSYLFVTFTQASIQRINSTPTILSARLLYIISGPLYCAFLVMTAVEGATVFAYYDHKGCDIYASGVLKNVNEIIPLTILELFQDNPGLPGLFIASLSSAALSTLSSCLSSLSAITYDDAMKVKYPNISDAKATRLSKLVVIFYGFVAMALALLMSRVPGTVTMLYSLFIGGIDGPMAAIFLLSIMFRKSTTKGMLIGGFCGIAVSEWLAIGKVFAHLPHYPTLPAGSTENCPSQDTYGNYNSFNRSGYITPVANASTVIASTTTEAVLNLDELSPDQQIYSISYVFISFIGFAITLILGALISLCTKSPDHVDPRCLYTFQTLDKKNDTKRKDKCEFKGEELNLMSE